MKGYAPGWQVRCPKCGITFDAADLGFIFIGKKVIGRERRLAWCQHCRRIRWLIIERKRENVTEHDGPRSNLAAHAASARR